MTYDDVKVVVQDDRMHIAAIGRMSASAPVENYLILNSPRLGPDGWDAIPSVYWRMMFDPLI